MASSRNILSLRMTLRLQSHMGIAVCRRHQSTMAPTKLKLNDISLLKSKAYINGSWVTSESSRTFSVRDPASGLELGTVPELTLQDTEQAVRAASEAFPAFRKLTGRERAKLLKNWHSIIVAHADDLANLITWENGKPLADARGEVAYAASFIEWFSEEAPRIYGDTIPASITGNRIFTLKEPAGLCALITPWNFPAAMITRKLGPALAAGCTVVVKAPGETPLTMLALAELAHRAGVPPGVVNVVTALENTPDVGQLLTTHPLVRKVSFTGSTAVGSKLMRQSAASLKKCSFELGGNAPFIVFEDADLDAAVAGAVSCKFRSSGQTCVCANRIYVASEIHDEFVERLAAKVSQFKIGPGYEPGVTHGPLIHERAVAKVQDHVQDARAKGAKLICGGSKLDDLGSNFFQPTILTDVTAGMKISTEETFGPVAAIFRFSTEEEVMRLANQTEVGLAGYLYSSDLQRIWRVAEALEVGMIGVNTGLISDPAAPFGGVKLSGFGREGSKYGIDEYTTIKTITLGGMGAA